METATAVSATAVPALLDVRETAALLHCSESWVRRHEPILPVVRLGGLVRFDRDLLDLSLSGKVFSGKSLGKESPVIAQRRYQLGSVYLTGKKTWYGMFREDQLDEHGILVRKQRKIRLGTRDELPTKTAARAELQKYVQQTQTSKPTTQVTLAEVVTLWKGLMLPTLKLSTQGVYRSGLKVALETLGNVPIHQLDRDMVQNFLNVKSKQYSRNSLHQFLRALSVVCSWAVPKYLEANPCTKVVLPLGNPVRELNRNGKLKPEQIKALSDSLPEPYSTFILFLYCAGLRVGEGAGVKWSDFNGNTLRLQRCIYQGKAGPLKTAKPDKPETQYRLLPIPESLMTRLETLGRKTEWVFNSRAGTPLDDGNMLRRYVKPAAKKLSIHLAGFHDLRHSAATALGIGQGINPKVVSGILGHSTLKETLGTYTHAGAADFAEPLNQLAAAVIQ
jgi:integrase